MSDVKDEGCVEGEVTYFDTAYELDYTVVCMAIGLKLEGGQAWLGLEPIELALLIQLLKGAPETESLKKIREFCEGALHFVDVGGLLLKKGKA